MSDMNDQEIQQLLNDLRILRGPDNLARKSIAAIESLLEERDWARESLCEAEAEVAMHEKVSTSAAQIAEEYGWNYLVIDFGPEKESA
jgi:hypothetical protein